MELCKPSLSFSWNAIDFFTALSHSQFLFLSLFSCRWHLLNIQSDSFQTLSQHGSWVPEWASEGVQLGGVGSALGILGLWTGADHERTDPLGVFSSFFLIPAILSAHHWGACSFLFHE
jgi:hypothetical protein